MEFLLISSAHFLTPLSPGPDFFLIMQASLRLPRRCSLAICSGIALATGVYRFFAVAVLEVVREKTWLVCSLKYLGAAYLLFLGIMLLRAPLQTFDNRENNSFLQVQDIQRQFLIGFTSAIQNPKNAIFYLSLFTVMVSTDTGLFTRYLYALWMMSAVFLWDCCVIMAIGHGRIKEWFGRSIYYIEKIFGAALALSGIFLPFT